MNNDDLRLAAIIKEGSQGDIVIVGSPFDYVRKRCINKGGQDNGPCCLRRFFGRVGPIVNPQYGISIQNVRVTDYGNISYKEQPNTYIPQKCIETISNQILQLLKNNRFPFVYGGSKQCLYGGAIAFHKQYNNSKHILISGKPNLNRPYDSDKLTSQNILTLLNHNFPHSVILFGANQQYFPKHASTNQFQNVTYNQIRNMKVAQTNQAYTQAGLALFSLLQKENCENIHVSLTVEAIQKFRGCRDVLNTGLSVQQIIQIFFILGRCKKVKLIDISQFNPSVQDYESSLLLVNLLYYFLLGWTKRQTS